MPNILPFGASNEEARPGCSPNGGTPGFPYDLLLIGVLDLALSNLFERHRQIVLRARLDERGQELVERAFAELVVIVVDLPGALRGHDHERVARVHVLQQVVDAGFDHRRGMVAVAPRRPRTSVVSSATARSRSSFSIMWSNSPACSSCFRASSIRSWISPELSVARSRRRRSSSSTRAEMKIVTAPGTSCLTRSAPSVSSSSSGTWPFPAIRRSSE